MRDDSTGAAGATIELLQELIRNACVNDGTPESGQEVRNADTLESYLSTSGLDVERYEPTPGRVSLVATGRPSASSVSVSMPHCTVNR